MSEYQDFTDLRVTPVSQDTAWAMAVSKHYSGKWNAAFGRRNYGIWKGDDLLGVAVYGHPMNPKSWPSVTTTDPARCIELNRLWLDDVLGRNAETWFLSRTFRLLRADGIELVQSFADGRLGVGTTYQAANFTYHGSSRTLFWRRRDTGEVLHGVPFTNAAESSAMVAKNMLIVRGIVEPFRVTTYRYLRPLTKGARRAILLPEQPYPKDRVGEIPADIEDTPPSQIARAAALAKAARDHAVVDEMSRWLEARGHDADTLIDDAADNPFVVAYREKHDALHAQDVLDFDFEGLGA